MVKKITSRSIPPVSEEIELYLFHVWLVWSDIMRKKSKGAFNRLAEDQWVWDGRIELLDIKGMLGKKYLNWHKNSIGWFLSTIQRINVSRCMTARALIMFHAPYSNSYNFFDCQGHTKMENWIHI